jgi:hypothetical protein
VGRQRPASWSQDRDASRLSATVDQALGGQISRLIADGEITGDIDTVTERVLEKCAVQDAAVLANDVGRGCRRRAVT